MRPQAYKLAFKIANHDLRYKLFIIDSLKCSFSKKR